MKYMSKIKQLFYNTYHPIVALLVTKGLESWPKRDATLIKLYKNKLTVSSSFLTKAFPRAHIQ